MLVSSHPSRNEFLVIAAKIYTEGDFEYCPSFLDFFYLVPSILSRIVNVYYSWEYIVFIFAYFQIFCAGLQMFIISGNTLWIASKKGDYI